MKRNIKPLTDAELLSACRNQAESGSTFLDSNLTEERRKVQNYYLGRSPAPMRDGGSKFVSQDVYLSVENMKAEIVETFGAGSQIVQFSPVNADDVDLAKHATKYCEYAVHRRNSGIGVFQDVVHDALTCRVGLAKVYWEPREEVELYSIEDVPLEQAASLIADPKVRLTAKPKTKEDPNTGIPLVSFEYEVVEDCSQVSIEAVPPEEFIIQGRSRSLDKSRYLAHRYRTTLGDLVEDGYDPDLVYSISAFDDDLAVDEESLQREADTIDGFNTDDESPDEASRMATVYESYIRIDALGTGRLQLWKVVHVGDVMLEKQRVADHPFLAYIPQPLPHTFWGNNFAARTIHHANTKTTLTRAIIEQAVDATNPRWQVARGGVANPRELLDNRRGGVVNVRDVGTSVAPMPQNPINPFVLQTIQTIDSDREDTTGISRLATGLDKKALSHQNSQGLVEQLTDNSKTRTKVIARNFAIQFVAPLYLKVYKLALANETQDKMLDVGGQFIPISPYKWKDRRDVKVDMTLGYGERDQRVSELADLHSALENSQKLSRMYGEEQAGALWNDILELKGIQNGGRYLADPQQLPPPEPDPMQQAELAKITKETEIMDRQQSLREQQVTAQINREHAEMLWKQATGKVELELKGRDALRKDRETDNRIDIGLAELELALDAHAEASPENTKLTAIASPNS